MGVVALAVAEFSRGLSNFLSQVQYQGQSLDIERCRRVVAPMLPAMATSGFLINQLDEALAKGPQLKTSERLAMAEDVPAVRASMKAKAELWG